jgi:hypothetical protein
MGFSQAVQHPFVVAEIPCLFMSALFDNQMQIKNKDECIRIDLKFFK